MSEKGEGGREMRPFTQDMCGNVPLEAFTNKLVDTTGDLNKRFARLAGICWHDWDSPVLHSQMYTCKLCGIVADIPWQSDFCGDPREVLKVMDSRPDGKLFYAHLMYGEKNVDAIDDDGHIERKYITTTGLLCKAATEWLEGRKEN
jgi:hypothetical protein